MNQADGVGYDGYLIFTAPKSKTYKFTISKLGAKGAQNKILFMTGCCYFDKKKGGRWVSQKVYTNGGKTTYLNLATKHACEDKDVDINKSMSASEKYLPSRYAKIKLKKGETVRMGIGFMIASYPYCTLKIS